MQAASTTKNTETSLRSATCDEDLKWDYVQHNLPFTGEKLNSEATNHTAAPFNTPVAYGGYC